MLTELPERILSKLISKSDYRMAKNCSKGRIPNGCSSRLDKMFCMGSEKWDIVCWDEKQERLVCCAGLVKESMQLGNAEKQRPL